MKRNRVFAATAAFAVAALVASCGGGGDAEGGSGGDSAMQALIEEGQGLTNDELYAKAIEESNGKTFYGIGNSSRGATAGENFVAMLQEIDPSYNVTFEWNQPKQNSIFTTLTSDNQSSDHVYSMTLIQDGNQIQSKMVNTGVLLNFIPKDFAEAEGVDLDANGTPLALQTLSKVFMVNNVNGDEYTNVWDFVADGEKPFFMGVNSEPVGKNFLYMLTSPEYSDQMKAAFDALPAADQAQFEATIAEMEGEAKTLGLEGENAKYGLAWVARWVSQYNEETDDGPIAQSLVSKSAAGATGLLVYSKLRAIEESAESSVANVDIAAYNDGYTGPGGFGYKHFLMIPETSPLPWTAMAFISYMVTEPDGFAAWGKDIGGYSPNPAVNQDHSDDGGTEYPQLNDKGYDWWTSSDGGGLVVEDGAYAAKVAPVMADWIDARVGK